MVVEEQQQQSNIHPQSAKVENLDLASLGEARNVPPEATSFAQIDLGQPLEKIIAAYGYWNVQFYQPSAGYVNFALHLPRGASLGLYGRKNGLPTHTNYDVMEVIKGLEGEHRNVVKRAIRVSTNDSFSTICTS